MSNRVVKELQKRFGLTVKPFLRFPLVLHRLERQMPRLIIHRLEAGVLHLSLNNTARYNALTQDMMKELTDIFDSVEANPEIRVITLRGEGKSFCTGIDLQEVTEPAQLRNKKAGRVAVKLLSDLLQAVVDCPIPVIAIGHGNVFGAGIGLLAAADITVAFESSSFAFSEVTLGLVPAIVAPYVVSRIGIANARRLFLTGEIFHWWDAKEMNLVNYVGAKPACFEFLNTAINNLKRGAPGAQATTKQFMKYFSGLEQQKRNISNTMIDLAARQRQSDEGIAGISAFLSKSEPPWRNK